MNESRNTPSSPPGMSAEPRSAADALFARAVELPPSQWDAFLREATDDTQLRAAVLARLAADDEPAHGTGALLGAVIGGVAALWADQARDADRVGLIGRRVGAYEITAFIGQGGMGAVYRARRADGQFDHDVAIKLVRHGFETPAALERFRQERQILARLVHPAIARLLDGGTLTDERGIDIPYLVMEHVDGQPITAFCEARRLSVPERVALFRRVSEGVLYAHQQMIVHRDLKPSNILVTGDGQPKLLDFGVAKLITEEAAAHAGLTSSGMPLLTPDYASPEQVRGGPAAAATDIYSLGAILYELLTGQKAHRFETLSPAAVERAICETATTEPSAAVARATPAAVRLRRQLEGDLDTIILKAMRKEPARRYVSVDHFSEDLRRHLEGLPVLARPDTVRYRAGKYVRRNSLSIAAAALVAVSLTAGTVVSVWQARRAERRFEQVRKLANSLIYDIHDAIRDLTGSTRARQTIVATGLEYLSGLEREAAGDPRLERDLAGAYQRIGDVQGGVLGSNLGDVKGALESYRKARALFERLPAGPDRTRQVAAVEVKIGDALSYHGDVAGALEAYARAQSIIEPMTAGADARPEDLQQLAVVFQSTARVQGLKRDMARGLESSLKLLALRRSLAERDRSNIAWRDALASAEAEVSMALHRMGNPREALPHARQALLVRELRAAEQPHNVEAQRGLILAYSHVADVLGNPTMASLGDVAGAIELYRKMTDIAERLAMADEADRRAKVDLANCLLRLGSALLAPPAADEGIVRLERSAALMRELAAAEPKDNRARSTLAFVYGRLGDARLASGRTAQALENYDQAIRVANGVLAADPAEFSVTPTLALALLGKGLTLAKAGHRDAAVREGSRGVEVLEHARIAQAANVRTATSAGAGHALMGRLYLSLGGPADLSQACSSFERSRQAYSQATRLDPQSAADLEAVTRELARCRPARTR